MADDSMAADNTQMDGAGAAPPVTQLDETEFEVVVKPIDENSPLHSAKTFEELGLTEQLLKGIYGMGFNRPSKIQESALPLILADPPVNMIAQSQSGTGKTAAFSLNILKRVDLSTPELQVTPQALVLAPTRELARQTQAVLQKMGSYMEGLKVGLAVPVEKADRGQVVQASVVAGTPGTATDMIKRKLLDPRRIKIVVLDEADNMLEASMGEQCQRIKTVLPKAIQILLFSATWPPHVVTFAKTFAPNANEMTLPQKEWTVEGIRQMYMDCASEEEKYECLVKLYGLMTVGQSVIFVKTRSTAMRVMQKMQSEGHECACLTGELGPTERDAVIDQFRSGVAKVLITTNVLSRGIDVQAVSMVVNYDVPDLPNGAADAETYLHRIGRTGRFGRVGVAISFVHDQKSWKQLSDIAEHYGTNILRVETTDWDHVEEVIQKVIKNPAAHPDYKPPRVEDLENQRRPFQGYSMTSAVPAHNPTRMVGQFGQLTVNSAPTAQGKQPMGVGSGSRRRQAFVFEPQNVAPRGPPAYWAGQNFWK